MSDRASALEDDAHAKAATAFVDSARARFGDAIEALYIFGSTARDEASGLGSDVDVLVVLGHDSDRRRTADALRDMAYDVMLEYGPVVELHLLSEGEFRRARAERDPFVETVVRDGRAYA